MNGQRPQPPYVYRLIRDASGQSETLGIILLLGITVVGTTAIIAFGSQALQETEAASHSQRTEHTMTLLDSRSAMVALGESEQQSVTFGASKKGTFYVQQDKHEGWIRVKHLNFSEDEHGDELIYNRSLGSFVYENGDNTIVYQGGGVWKISGDGEAQMVSQPEFHYRGATLTLPIIRVSGSGESVGRTTATVKSKEDARRIYPNNSLDSPGGPNPKLNETGAPYNNSSTDGANGADHRTDALQYTNPIDQGNITITIGSEYYRAWADYFRDRTTAKVNVHDDNKTVHVKLQSLGDPGFFGNLQDDIKVRGMTSEQHSVSNFTVNLTEGKSGAGAFGSMHWSFYASSGSQKLEMHVTTDGAKCTDVRDGNDPVLVSMYYENGSDARGHSQEWRGEVDTSDGDFIEDVNCGSDDESIVVNWTAGLTNSETMLEYEQITALSCGNSKWHWADDHSKCDGDGPGTAPMGQHDVDDGSGTGDPADLTDDGKFTTGEQANVSFLTRHYMALLAPNFDIQGDEGPGSSNRILEDESSGTLSFDQSGGKFITYLHITENEVEIEVD